MQPLASFTNGLDTIRDIVVSASKKMAEEKYLESNPEIFAETCASIQTCLTNIRNTNAFMLMAINRCLDYTKASKGMKLVPKYETVDLREALQFPIECMSNIQERIGIKLGALSEEICSHIITDKHWLQENLLCLLSNAVKYSTEGNVTITVTRTTSKSISKPGMFRLSKTLSSLFGKQSSNITNKIVPTVLTNDSEHEIEDFFLLFEIEDTGIGISEEKAKNLFNPFKQAQRLAGGTGLGLYSLAKRIEALKGDYGVRKRKDMEKGSLFWFTLPYKPDTASAASKDNLLDQPFSCNNKQSFSSNSLYTNADDILTILLVDDAPSILKMSAMMLKRQGYQIWTAENGEIALNRIKEKWKNTGKGFDIVLMDLQMPVMDGLEATRRLRQMEKEGCDWMKPGDNILKGFTPNNVMLCRQIIIGLSANSDHETVIEAFNAGVDDFIGKPFSITTFNTMIERFF